MASASGYEPHGLQSTAQNKSETGASQAQDEKEDDAPTEPPAQQANPVASEDYSVFTVNQKRSIILAGSFIGWFSPMSGSIYYPALNQIAADLDVSSSKVSITVTTYLAGRRPAYFICFTIYVIANLALALQNNYIALLILRMLQSAGSSGTIALAQGLVGDLVVSSERGKYVAFASLGSILGPTLSPILGGLLSQYLGWHWIFWFLLILSIAAFIPMFLFLPETCRNVVSDGSVPPPKTSWNVSDQIRFKTRARKGIPVDEEKLSTARKNYRLEIPNPLSTLVVLIDLESVLILVPGALAVACFYSISTGASDAFHRLYGFDELKISLMFLPIGGGSLISAFTTGALVDWNYRRWAKKLGYPMQKNRQTDLSNFPIERARLEISLPLLLTASLSVIGYGWLMDHKVSLAGPIIMLFTMGYSLIAGFQTLNTLMIDIYPGKPATVTAANNVVRCLLGAAATSAIIPMSEAMGNGWAYTLLALLFVVASVGSASTMKYGIKWRKARKEREDRKAKAKEAETERTRGR